MVCFTGAVRTAVTRYIINLMKDVPLIGDVEIPIGDKDTLLTDTGETYRIKGEPDFMEKNAQAELHR